MKNSQKGFIVPLIVIIIAVLVIGGTYAYSKKQSAESPASSLSPAMTVAIATPERATAGDPQADTNKKAPAEKSPVISETGTLKGTVSIDQPISRDCPKPTPVGSFGIKVYQNGNLVKRSSFNSDGTFAVSLLPGIYTIYGDSQEPGMVTTPDMWGRILPQKINVLAGSSTVLNLNTKFICNAI